MTIDDLTQLEGLVKYANVLESVFPSIRIKASSGVRHLYYQRIIDAFMEHVEDYKKALKPNELKVILARYNKEGKRIRSTEDVQDIMNRSRSGLSGLECSAYGKLSRASKEHRRPYSFAKSHAFDKIVID